MLRISNVNKYFFKGKKNQIHVIDNTSLDFDKNGLVALLGPSGCGKTTLLNAIGGLDKVNDGDIFINNHCITKTSCSKKDAIRNEYVGYIFQNYNLVEDMTVFDNVALVLKMLGIKDKSEIEKKVKYVLEKVGMWRYRKRYANMLSGGERQRVGIARAIVKNPPIIIADEPTGNLDSKNTLEVMNIIKAISKDKLVILVTHEEKLANFYATRIIRILDGKVVSDEANDQEKSLDYMMDNRIYLGDMDKNDNCVALNTDINLYRSDDEKIDLDIVIRNGNIYIRTKDYKKRIEVVDKNSSIEIVDGHYKEMTKEEQEKYEFDSEILKHTDKIKYSSTMNLREMIKNGFQKVMNYPRMKKILMVGFLLSSMFMLYAISNVLGVMTLDETQFVKINRDYIKVENKDISIKDFLKHEKNSKVNYMLPGDSIVGIKLKMDNYYQTSVGQEVIRGSLSDIKNVKKEWILEGRLPKNKREIVIDNSALTENFSGQDATLMQAGYKNKKDLIGEDVEIGLLGNFKIVGILDSKSPTIYMDKTYFNDVIANSINPDEEEKASFVDYNNVKKNIKIKGGKAPKDYEVMVSTKKKYEMPIGTLLDEKINGKFLKVSGYFDDENSTDAYIVNSKMLKYKNIQNNEGAIAYARDKDKVLEYFYNSNLNAGNSYDISKEKYQQDIRSQMVAMMVMAGIIFIISIIEIYLMMRASFLSRIKEIGVYRAIGMKKSDIYKMFVGEISAITLIGSMPGFLFMSYILYKLTQISMLQDQYMFNLFVVLLGAIVIFGVNLLFGLLPVWKTVRKTPAEILARTDI